LLEQKLTCSVQSVALNRNERISTFVFTMFITAKCKVTEMRFFSLIDVFVY